MQPLFPSHSDCAVLSIIIHLLFSSPLNIDLSYVEELRILPLTVT